MTFSFTTPTDKPIFSPITKSWLACFFASFLIVLMVFFILGEQTRSMINQTNSIDAEIDQQGIVKANLQSKIQYLNTQIQQISNIKQENSALLAGLENLFRLIPEQITLDTISLDNDSLTIKGITPSKELYLFLLESPLKAIFNETSVDFFVLPSGWYNFVSINKIIKPQGNNNAQ
ncbi:hypothetical protein CQA62_00340 [Helicobacter cholecystus]|uniref:Uncharacterized protein n=1 Tax=Helicobacter cholecystus TaxID=45498 RepID=A0A3D8IXB6_9HELI|nr:hypothetical protein [Helicobacter cholecystus]RDU69898.1 hypothetical protein CQA62_00340 [Helicobacter cholecystus]VEJ25062.1 membrane protein [Helicobacter cholecystus]